MSTSETVDFELGNCPCGSGKVIKSVTTQDNPWSTADISFSIACATCNRDWYVQHGKLVQRSSEIAYNAASQEEQTQREPLSQLTSRLVDAYFERFAAKTKKAEHAEMVRLGINADNYRSFLRRKANAKSYSDLCYGLRNMEWLTDLAIQEGVEEKLAHLLKAHAAAKRRTSEAYAQIVRRPLPQ